MFTSGEKRGLIALVILLGLLLLFVVGRRALFSPPVSSVVDSRSDSIATEAVMMAPAAPVDTIVKVRKKRRNADADSVKRKKKRSAEKTRREPIVRDPLSEPLNSL
ncbi:MAG: hypothetical protein HFJ95_06800 [Muribaculaceae bacterium]|nr:hypothetical protein [Muribaculaceae bacterium]